MVLDPFPNLLRRLSSVNLPDSKTLVNDDRQSGGDDLD